MNFANEAGRTIDHVGQGRDSWWGWWRSDEGLARMRSAMADPAMQEFAPAGDISALEWVSAHSDYLYLPRRFLADGRLHRCLSLLAWHAVYLEIAIPTCVHLCAMAVPETTLTYQEHSRVILWGEERRVIDAAFIEASLAKNIIVHPVKLGLLNDDGGRRRIDAAMMQLR